MQEPGMLNHCVKYFIKITDVRKSGDNMDIVCWPIIYALSPVRYFTNKIPKLGLLLKIRAIKDRSCI